MVSSLQVFWPTFGQLLVCYCTCMLFLLWQDNKPYSHNKQQAQLNHFFIKAASQRFCHWTSPVLQFTNSVTAFTVQTLSLTSSSLYTWTQIPILNIFSNIQLGKLAVSFTPAIDSCDSSAQWSCHRLNDLGRYLIKADIFCRSIQSGSGAHPATHKVCTEGSPRSTAARWSWSLRSV
jgi:hypothetical protein